MPYIWFKLHKFTRVMNHNQKHCERKNVETFFCFINKLTPDIMINVFKSYPLPDIFVVNYFNFITNIM